MVGKVWDVAGIDVVVVADPDVEETAVDVGVTSSDAVAVPVATLTLISVLS